MADAWTIAASTGTAAAAIFAGVQIWLSKRDANRRATLDALLLIDSRLQALWGDDTAAVQRELIKCYSDMQPPSEACQRYLAFLNSLDVVAFSIENGLLDGKLATRHVNTLLTEHLVSLSFLTEFQRCYGDMAVYENLMRYYKQQIAKNRLPRPQGEQR
jgi:hypothetical protein